MKCPKCGAELSDGTKFCSFCGEKIEAISGKKFNDESKSFETEEYKSAPNADEKYSSNNQHSSSNLTVSDKIINKGKEKWSRMPLFSKVLMIVVVVSVLLGLIALSCGKTWAVVIAVLQVALIAVGWLAKEGKIKQSKKWLPNSLIALAIVLFIPFFGLFSNSGIPDEPILPTVSDSNTVSEAMPMYTIDIKIDCAANLFFSTYDLKVLVDSDEIGTLKHGEKSTFNAQVKKGTHTLEIQNADDSSVKGEVNFEVNQDSSYKYEVSCKNDKVNIAEMSKINPPIIVSELGSKSYDDVKKLFTDAGFTNVTTKEIKDLTIDKKDKSNIASNISIDSKSDFTKDTTYYKNAKIEIEYHTFSQKDYDAGLSKALEETFPVENAKRAAVVAITNGMATDVFKKDRSTYDASKFHSYADTSGDVNKYFMNVTSFGTWTVKNNKTWHVDSLALKNSLGVVANVALDVNFDGTNYVVSNIKGTFGNPGATAENSMDLSEIESGSKDSIYLTVPEKLIKSDRSQTKVDSLDHTGDLNETAAQLAFENYGKTQYPYGFKCHWILDLRNEEQASDGSWTFKVGVTITNQYGTKADIIVAGTVCGTTANPIVKSFDVQ